MRAKDVAFDVTYVNLREKPDWFLEISPHGKVPVLKVAGAVLFESNAIAEYLDEMVPPKMHPLDPIKRARNRAWTDYVPTFAAALGKVTYAQSAAGVAEGVAAARPSLARLETAIKTERENAGPFFNGAELSLVDAAYAPFFQRFRIVDAILRTGLLDGFPRVSAWADTLLSDPRVTGAVAPEFPTEFAANLKRRETHAWAVKSGVSR